MTNEKEPSHELVSFIYNIASNIQLKIEAIKALYIQISGN